MSKQTSQSPDAAPKQILKTLAIGIGGRGQWPLQECEASNGFQIVALCDTSPDSLAKGRQITGLPESACYQDFKKAVAASGIDCVIVCAPTIFHSPIAKAAIDQGLPVLVEKGMAPDWNTARDLVAYADAMRGKLCVSQNYRYNALERTVRRIIGTASDPHHPGPIHLIDFTHHRVRPEPRTLSYPFASVWDMSCHHFDDLRFWLGPVKEVTAFAFKAPWSKYEHPNNTSAFMRFANGVSVNYFHGHDSARGECRLAIHGQRGCLFGQSFQMTATVSIDSLEFSSRPQEQFGEAPTQSVPMAQPLGEAGVLADFHAYVTQDREPGISAQQNLEVMAICHMVQLSASERRPVTRAEID